jgi:hypothetical protein
MLIMTLVWGFGLLAQTVVSCVLVFRIPIPTYLIVSPILGYGTMGLLGLWTFLYVKRKQKRGDAVKSPANAT